MAPQGDPSLREEAQPFLFDLDGSPVYGVCAAEPIDRRLACVLHSASVLSLEQLEHAADEARRCNASLGSVLLAQGLVAQNDYYDILARITGLARLSRQELLSGLSGLTPDEAAKAVQSGMVPIAGGDGDFQLFASDDPDPSSLRAGHDGPITALVAPDELMEAVETVHGAAFAARASQYLACRAPEFCARQRITKAQSVFLLLGASGVAAALSLAQILTLTAAKVMFGAFFLASSIWRLGALIHWRRMKDRDQPEPLQPDNAALPVYTILVPLYREAAILPHLVKALGNIDYPAHKLDIKLLLEENDAQSLEAVRNLTLPAWFKVIVVPRGAPQTKPRALNYGLHFARGAFLAVYDAEDAPERDQLRKAVATFTMAPSDIACLQASLNFYNANENWITRQFAIEYAALFDLLLPVLSALRLPLPLGGTSNHFRADALRAVLGWDAWNMTEDADLGLRLARKGWRVAMLASTTYEEANGQLGSWIRQRSRWAKGWLQTWLVHMRSPAVLWREVGGARFIFIQLLLAGITVSNLVHPIFYLTLLADFAVYATKGVVLTPFTILGVVVLVTGYGSLCLTGYLALGARAGLKKLRRCLVSMPFYWLLASLGTWRAMWHFIRKPFYWDKTEHAVSACFAAPQANPLPCRANRCGHDNKPTA